MTQACERGCECPSCKIERLTKERDDLRKTLKRLIVWIDTEDLPDELCTPEYLAVKQAARDAVKEGQA